MVAAVPFEFQLDALTVQTPIHTTALMAVNVAVPTPFSSSCSSVRLRIEDERFNSHYSDIPLTYEMILRGDGKVDRFAAFRKMIDR
jgi:hypothetical protein